MLDADQVRDLLAAASVRSACAEDRARLEEALRSGVMRYGKHSERAAMRHEERQRRQRDKWRRSAQQRRDKAKAEREGRA